MRAGFFSPLTMEQPEATNVRKTFLYWSSGKDAALALHLLSQDSRYSVQHLLTTINTASQEVVTHGIPKQLLLQQLAATGIAASLISVPQLASNAEYEYEIRKHYQRFRGAGFSTAAFGDIFLEDVRNYRTKQLQQESLEAVFPLWKRNTAGLMTTFLNAGFKAIVVSINEAVMPESFLGRIIDERFISELPPNVDPCGENGEFHTFCFDGPIFNKPIHFTIGNVQRDIYSYNKTSSLRLHLKPGNEGAQTLKQCPECGSIFPCFANQIELCACNNFHFQ